MHEHSNIDLRTIARAHEHILGRASKSSGGHVRYSTAYRGGDSAGALSVGQQGYTDFANGDSGGVQAFMTRILGYPPAAAVEYLEALAGGTATSRPAQPAQAIEATGDHEPPSAEWQRIARDLMETAAGYLWSAPGNGALDYLRQRGLSDETIRAARLGFNPVWSRTALKHPDTGKAVSLAPGIVIPWSVDGAFWALRIRRIVGNMAVSLGRTDDTNRNGSKVAKYTNLTGSKQSGALFSGDTIATRKPVLIVEGEFDALLAAQHLGDRVAVVTLGSASNKLARRWLEKLRHAGLIYGALDNDEAGQKAAARLAEQFGDQFQPVNLPSGKDITEFVAEYGGDLCEWWERVSANQRRMNQCLRVLALLRDELQNAARRSPCVRGGSTHAAALAAVLKLAAKPNMVTSEQFNAVYQQAIGAIGDESERRFPAAEIAGQPYTPSADERLNAHMCMAVARGETSPEIEAWKQARIAHLRQVKAECVAGLQGGAR